MNCRHYVLEVVFFLLLVCFSRQSVRCNQRLLATFKLKGMEYSINNQMMSCPHVRNRCCSLMDEVRIVQLWNQYSRTQTKIFSNQLFSIYKNFLELHQIFKTITTDEMVFQYLSYNVLHPQRRVCTQGTHVRELRRWGKFIELQRMFPGRGAVRRVGTQAKYKYLVKMLLEMMKDKFSSFKLLPKLSTSLSFGFFRKLDQVSGKPVTRKQRKQLGTLFQSPLKNFMKAQKNFSKAAQKFAAKSYLQAGGTFKALQNKKSTKKKVLQNKPQNETDKKVKSRLPRKLASKMNFQKVSESTMIYLPFGTNYLSRFKFFTRMRVPFIPVTMEIPTISCTNKFSSVTKPFMVLNEEKFRYCNTAIDKMMNFDSDTLKNALDHNKAIVMDLLEHKKSLYCSICDAHEQRMFDMNRGLVVYSQEFCYDLLNKFKEYIIFKNIMIVDFIDTLMQVQECVQSTGDENNFPSINKLSWMRRRIPFIQRCFDNLDKDTFYVYCRFMCVQYRIQDYSNFFEGDIQMMTEMYSTVMSFLRARKDTNGFDLETHQLKVAAEEEEKNAKKGTKATKEDQDNLDEEEQQLNVHNPIKGELSYSEHFIKGEIYEKIQKPVSVDDLRSFFSENIHGLNPISSYAMIDFKVNIEEILLEQQRRSKGESLEITTIESYFDIRNTMIKDYNRDAFIEVKEVIEEPVSPEILKKKERENRKKHKPKRTKIDDLPYKHNATNPMGSDIPDWNKEFSKPDQPDTTSTWLNFFFHRA